MTTAQAREASVQLALRINDERQRCLAVKRKPNLYHAMSNAFWTRKEKTNA